MKVYGVYENNVSILNYVPSSIRKEIGELYTKVLTMNVLRVDIIIYLYSFFLLLAIIPNVYHEQIINFIIVLL